VEEKEKNKQLILIMALSTLLGMPLIALLIDWFVTDLHLVARLLTGEAWWIQLVWGLGVGLVSAFIAYKIISLKFMEGVRIKYARMLGDMDLTTQEIVFISICAGIGEEILFRGALQPLLGIFLTAIIFVAIHGYLNPRDWRISVYGLFMTVVIIGFGFMTELVGIWSAVVAHFVIDVYLLTRPDVPLPELISSDSEEIQSLQEELEMEKPENSPAENG
jgi:uncharacterized protein